MPTSPHVELLAPGVGLAGAAVDGRIGSIEETIASGLMSYRLMVINYVKTKIADEKDVTSFRILELLNEASALFLGRFNGIVGPAAATAYVRAYRAADAGDVPLATIYALADQHTRRIAAYYDETSREALVAGFNTFVNRQIPTQVAAMRALDAYGLTPRQMSGYTSLDLKQQVKSARPISLKRRALEYIGTSIRQRAKIFAKQEAHNLDLQAKQTAWLWMQDKGALTALAQKMWLTAKDEKTCVICGPMHGKKVGIADRFELPNGIKVWVPGPHPNCRCEIRIIDLIGKAEGWDRDKDGWIYENTERERRAGGSEHTVIDDLGNEAVPFQGRNPATQVAGQVAPRTEAKVSETAATTKVVMDTINQQIGNKPVEDLSKDELNLYLGGLQMIASAAEREGERSIVRTMRQEQERAVQRWDGKQQSLREEEMQRAIAQQELDDALKEAKEKPRPLEPLGQYEEVRGLEPLAAPLMPLSAPALEPLAVAALEPLEEAKPRALEPLGEEKAEAEEKPKPMRQRPLVAPLDYDGRTYYSVIDYYEPNNTLYELHDEEFIRSRDQALADAARKRRHKIEGMVLNRTDGLENMIKFDWIDRAAPTGAVMYEARITPDQFSSILRGIAALTTQEGKDNEDSAEPFEIRMYLKGRDRGETDDQLRSVPITREYFTARELADKLDVNPETFGVKILAVNQVHDHRGGQGYHGASSSYGTDYEITGAYEEYGMTITDYDREGDIPVDIVTVAPHKPAMEDVPDE